MSNTLMAQAAKIEVGSASAKAVLMRLADHANGRTNSNSSWPSVDTLMQATEFSRRTVQRAIKRLEELGLVKRSPRFDAANSHRQTSNCYELVLPAIAEPVRLTLVAASGRRGEGATMARAPAPPRRPNLNTELESEQSSMLVCDGFEDFWDAYPRQIERKRALDAYRQALSKASAQHILEGARRYAASVRLEDDQFIQFPARWLDGERWEDEAA